MKIVNGRSAARPSSVWTPPADKPDAITFLLLQYDQPLGAATLATATIEAIGERCPGAQVTVATTGTAAEIMARHRGVKDIIVTAHPQRDFLSAIVELYRATRGRSFEYLITDVLAQTRRMAMVSLAVSARHRIGYASLPLLSHRSLRPDWSKGIIANNLAILDSIGYAGGPVEPLLNFTRADLEKARAWLEPSGSKARIVLATQTSKGHPNAWFDEHWVELAKSLTQSVDCELVFVGSKLDSSAIETLRSQVGGTSVSLAGSTSIAELAALLSQCDLVISLDTGTFHVARAVRVPSVVVGHAANPRSMWLPEKNPLFTILRRDDLSCAHCLLSFCATRECMQGLDVKTVLRAALGQLKRYPPNPSSRQTRNIACLNHG